jgi:hypothetical protein
MAELNTKDLVLKLAEQISELTSKVSELETQKLVATGKVRVEVTGTDNKEIIKFVKSIYTRKKYNKGGNIRSINVDNMETTKGGHGKVFITKTFTDGTQKSHPIIFWNK